MLRILCSARDPGGAWQIKAFIEEALDRSFPVEFLVVANPPAFDILRSLPVTVEACPLADDRDHPLAQAEEAFARFQPDLAFPSLSYPGFQIDEAIHHVARERGIPSVAIQDYWGYTGCLESLPDRLFVADSWAAELTARLTQNQACFVITGSPRHFRLRKTAADLIARTPAPATPNITFFAQPRDTPGVWENLNILFANCGLTPIRLRLHPKEAGDEAVYEALASAYGVDVTIVPSSETIEESLLAASVVVTCFSSSATEHHHLQLASERPLGPVIFLQVGPDLAAFIAEGTDGTGSPSVRLGLAQLIDRAEDLAPALQRALADPSAGLQYQRAVRHTLGQLTDPINLIWSEITALTKS